MIFSTIAKLSKTIHLNYLFELMLWMCKLTQLTTIPLLYIDGKLIKWLKPEKTNHIMLYSVHRNTCGNQTHIFIGDRR